MTALVSCVTVVSCVVFGAGAVWLFFEERR